MTQSWSKRGPHLSPLQTNPSRGRGRKGGGPPSRPPTQDMLTLSLSRALPLASPSPPGLWQRSWAGRSQQSARHCKRKRRETAPGSPRSKAWKNSAAGANTKDFSNPAAKVPSEHFFFFFLTAIRVTSLSKGQQLASVSRKLVWHGAGIGATLMSEVQKEGVIRKGLRFNKLFELFHKVLAFQFKSMFRCSSFKPETVSKAMPPACF